MQSVKMHPDWMHCIPCSVKKWNPIECSGFYAAWTKASWLSALDSMEHHWMQRIPCIVLQLILIVCSGVNGARPNASRLNALDYMQHGPKHPNWMQWIPCSVNECRRFQHCGAMDPDCLQWSPCSKAQCIPMECSGFYAAWPKSSRLNAVDYMQHDCSSVIDYAAV